MKKLQGDFMFDTQKFLHDMYFNHKHRLFVELCEIKDLETFETETVLSKDDITAFALKHNLEFTEIDEHTFVVTDNHEKLSKITSAIKYHGIPIYIIEGENKFIFHYYNSDIDDVVLITV